MTGVRFCGETCRRKYTAAVSDVGDGDGASDAMGIGFAEQGFCSNCVGPLGENGGIAPLPRDARGVSFDVDADGFPFYPTPCCGVHATGSSVGDGDSATVCRACYAEIDSLYGAVPELTTDQLAAEVQRRKAAQR